MTDVCHSPADVHAFLATRFGERPVVELTIKADDGDWPAKLYANPQTLTWTLVLIREACAYRVSDGEAFRPVKSPSL